MNYQQCLQDLFAAVQCPLCQISPEGRVSFKLIPQRFKGEEQYLQDSLELAKNFARSTGDPQLLAAPEAIGAVRLPDYSVVLIGPLTAAGRGNQALRSARMHSVNLFLKMLARLITFDLHPASEEDELLQRIGQYVPKAVEQISGNQKLNAPHNQFRYEAAMIEAIRAGDLTQLEHAFAMPLGGKIGILAPDHLRSLKNHAHIANVLASRAAIAEGIPYEEAFTLSDKFFNAVERLNDPDECWAIRTLIAQAFTLQVKNYKDGLLSHEPPLVKKARQEITRRIFAKTSIEEIAEAVGCSADYLGKLFKDTHHVTLSQYLRSERIKTAKDLLSGTSTSIDDIAKLLHFASSAHFCRVFKQECGLTALQYRAQQLSQE